MDRANCHVANVPIVIFAEQLQKSEDGRHDGDLWWQFLLRGISLLPPLLSEHDVDGRDAGSFAVPPFAADTANTAPATTSAAVDGQTPDAVSRFPTVTVLRLQHNARSARESVE